MCYGYESTTGCVQKYCVCISLIEIQIMVKYENTGKEKHKNLKKYK